jgi:hypothetical protein
MRGEVVVGFVEGKLDRESESVTACCDVRSRRRTGDLAAIRRRFFRRCRLRAFHTQSRDDWRRIIVAHRKTWWIMIRGIRDKRRLNVAQTLDLLH